MSSHRISPWELHRRPHAARERPQAGGSVESRGGAAPARGLPGGGRKGGVAVARSLPVTPDFRRGTKCISYVRQDQFTHI
jgi:hypothetical protein